MNRGHSNPEADDIPMCHHAYPLKYTYLFDPLKISAQNLIIITARNYRGQVQYQQYYCVKINLCEKVCQNTQQGVSIFEELYLI